MQGMLLLVFCTLSSAIASIFLKQSSQSISGEFSLFDLASNLYVWLGGIAYVAVFFGYVYVLRTVPLSLVQPTITAGASVLSVLAAVWFFKEAMSTLNWAGLLLVCMGIFMLFLGRV